MGDASSISSHETRGSWQRDLLASVVVFLVALPLCMGIAIASGAPVAAGLATGIIGGIVVGLIAGAPLQVSGPAAGLTVIVLGIVQQQGLEALGLVVMVAGVLQIVAGLTGIGQWFRAVSPAVVEGMLAGIGILIFAGQFQVMVDSAPHRHGWENIYYLPTAIRQGLPWPESTSAEQRKSQSEWLRELGTLHADQVQLESQLARQPHEKVGSQPKLDADRYVALLPRQQAIVTNLQALWQKSLQLTSTQLADRRRLALQMNLKVALEAAEHAQLDLQQGNIESARTTQAAASSAVTTARNAAKDHATAAKLGLLTIAIMLLWQWLPWKKVKMIPAPLIAVTIATAIAAASFSPVLYVEVPHQIASDLRFPSLAPLLNDWWGVLQMGLVVALIASAETLLCASAVDQMHQGPRTKYNRELAAQGVGNLLCGLINALPMTGVIVRSAANVQAGAASRLSTILHGIWLLVFVVLLASLLRMIPIASLAAMLVYTGVRLVNFKALRTFWRLDKFEAAVFVITASIVVFEGLLEGVVVGIVLAAAKLLWQFSYLKVDVRPAQNGEPIVVNLSGAATFLRLPQLAQALEKISPKDKVKLLTGQLNYIDHACLELITHWQKRHLAAGGELELNMEELASRYRHRELAAGEANA